MPTPFHPTLLLGLDGATFTILDVLCEQGIMPNLRSLLARGVRGPLLSTPHPLTPPAWTTVMTGKNPGQHGIFDFLRAERRPSGAFFTLNSFRDIQTETIWSIVDRAGGRVLCVNFPLTAPPPRISGVVVPGLLTARHLRTNVHPPETYETLKAVTNNQLDELSWDFSNETKALQAVAADELERWVHFHVVRETHWFNVLQAFLQSAKFDLTAVVFDGVDKLQHACWRLLDPAHAPRSLSDFERRIRDACLTYFRNLDGFIGKAIATAGVEARVLVVSDHGFGPTQKLFRVNSWLHAQGYLTWPEETEPKRVGLRAGHHVAIDMDNSTAFAQSGATNGIHIRLSERPGDGGVLKGDYLAFRQRLIDQLLGVQDPLSGTRIVREVLTREDAFPGPFMERAPDLTLVMFDHGFVSVVRTEDVITTRPEVIGTHYPEGVLIAAGPGILRGKTAPKQSIVDVASTVLYSLGLPVPEDFEGRVMDDLFDRDLLRRQPPTIGPPTRRLQESTPAATTMNLDRTEEEKILNQLRALGYVE